MSAKGIATACGRTLPLDGSATLDFARATCLGCTRQARWKCARCDRPRRAQRQGLCRKCHSENMVQWRAKEKARIQRLEEMFAQVERMVGGESSSHRPRGTR